MDTKDKKGAKKATAAPKKAPAAAAKKEKAPAAKKVAVEKKGKPAPATKKAAAAAAAAAPKGKTAKKPAAAQPKLTMQQRIRKLFVPRPKSTLLGQGLPPKRDLTHFMKWPKYIRIARQKKILMDRLKTPPPINLFRHTLDKATVVSLFKFLDKMRPEEKQARKKRRMEGAQYIAKAIADAAPAAPAEQPKEKEDKPAAAAAPAAAVAPKEKKAASLKKKAALQEALKTLAARRPLAVKYGLNHVTNLVEKNKAQLVVIAHDVDPIELVVWLPALCRKKKIPFCVVKSKARLGRLVHKKTCSCLCVTKVKKELRDDFAKLVDTIKPQFLENASLLRTWGEGKFGLKHRQRKAKQLRRIAKAEAGKAALAAQHS